MNLRCLGSVGFAGVMGSSCIATATLKNFAANMSALRVTSTCSALRGSKVCEGPAYVGSVMSSSGGVVCASSRGSAIVCARATSHVVASIVASIVGSKAKHDTGLSGNVPYTNGAKAAGSGGSN